MAKNSSPSLGINPGGIKLVHDSNTKQFGDSSNSDRITTDYRIEYAPLQDGQRLQFWEKGTWFDEQPSPLKNYNQTARSGNGIYKLPISQYVRLRSQNGFSRPIQFRFSLLGANSGYSSGVVNHYLALAQDTGNDGDRNTTNPQIISNHKTFDNVQFYVDGAWQDEQPKPRDGDNYLFVRLIHRDRKILHHTNPSRSRFYFRYLNLPAPKLELAESSSNDSSNLIIQDTKFKFSNIVRSAWVEYQVEGKWLRELPDLAPGEYSIPVRQRLDDGHISPIEKLKFTLATPVNLPSPEIKLKNDTGNSETDLRTNDGELEIGGLVKGAIAQYLWSDNQWQDKAPVLEKGKNIIQVRQKDAEGNTSESTKFEFTLLELIELPALEIKLKNDTGNSDTDRRTNDGELKIGGLVKGAIAQYLWSDNQWQDKVPVLEKGKNIIQVRQKDAEGNTSESTKFEFTLLGLIELPAVEIKLKNDTGNSDTDRRTNDGELKIGGLVKGAIAQYLWSDNQWHDKVPVLEKGKNIIQVRQKDAEGNTSELTKFEFTLLELIELPAVEIKLKNDTGNSDTDLRTNDGELKIGGLVKGAIAQYLWSDNEWHDKIPVLEKGKNIIQVRQKDAEGNLSEISSFEFTLLTKQELQPLVISLKNDTGWHESNPEWGSDLITTDPALQISGKAKDSEIEYKFDQYKGYGEPINGLWSKWKSEWGDNYRWKNWHWQYPVDFGGNISDFSGPVENTIHFRQVDADGNMSKETSFAFNLYPTFNYRKNVGAPALSVKNDRSTSLNHPSWYGGRSRDHQLVMSEEPKEGQFYEWKGPVATSWSTTYPPRDDFSVGQKNTVWVRRRDLAGNISRSNSLTFDLEEVPKDAITPSLSLKNDTGIDGDNVTTELALVLAGYFGVTKLSFRHSYRESEFAQPASDDQWYDRGWHMEPGNVQNFIDSKIRKLTKPGYYTFEVQKEYQEYVAGTNPAKFEYVTSPVFTLNVQLVGDSSTNDSSTNDRPAYTPNKKPETLPISHGHSEDTGLGAVFTMLEDSGPSKIDKRTNPSIKYTGLFKLLQKDALPDSSSYQYQMNGSSWRIMTRQSGDDMNKAIWTFPYDSPYWKGANTISIRYFDGANDYSSEPYVYQWYLGDDTSEPAASASQQSIQYDLDEDVVEYWEDTGLGFKVKLKDDLGYSSTDKITSSDQLELVFTDQVDGNFTIEYKHSQAEEWSLLADAASFSVGESVDSSHSFGSVAGANTLLLRRINSDGSETDPYSFAYTYDVDATSVFGSDQLTGNSLASTFSNALPESSVERFSLFSRFVLSNRPAFRDEFVDSIIGFYPSTGDQLLMERGWIQAKSRKNLLAVVDGRRAERKASKSKASLVYNQKSGDLFLNGNADQSGWGNPKIGGLLVELDSNLILHEANIVLI